MLIRRILATVLCLGLAPFVVSSLAMTVQPPTFPELVDEASIVARARVHEVTSRALIGSDGQRIIKTFVTFSTITAIKGEPPAEFTLSFLGGTVEGETWRIHGMPTFEVGQEEFLFATNDGSLCPLVGAMHGRYRVLSDRASTRRYIARDNEEPLVDVADVAAEIEPAAEKRSFAHAVSAALTPEQFERAVSAEIRQPTRRPFRP